MHSKIMLYKNSAFARIRQPILDIPTRAGNNILPTAALDTQLCVSRLIIHMCGVSVSNKLAAAATTDAAAATDVSVCS